MPSTIAATQTTRTRSGLREATRCRPVRLTGGWGGSVHRIGGTVRREAGSWTPAVHELLAHLEDAGFDAAPRALGINADGTELLTFVDGQTGGASSGWPAWARTENYLASVGQLIRRFHDAVEDFVPSPNSIWRSGSRELRPGEIIGHNDISPANLVAAGSGRAHGIIDWDQAGPTTRERELAYAAWQLVGLHAPKHAEVRGWKVQPDVARRLRVLVDAYGLRNREGFVDEIISRINEIISELEAAAAQGTNPTAKQWIEILEADVRFIASNRSELQHALNSPQQAAA